MKAAKERSKEENKGKALKVKKETTDKRFLDEVR